MYKYVSLLFICVYNLGNINVAEEVKIVDVAGGPAAEATLQELLKVMKAGGAGGGSGGGKSAAAATKAQDLYTTATTRGTKTRQTNTKAVKDSTSAFEKLSAGFGGIFGTVGNVLGGLTGIAKNFGVAMTQATTIGGVLEAVPIFGSVLGQATGYFQSSVESFRQLSEVGAGFGNDMMAIRGASAEAGLSLEQFSAMVSSNSESLGLLGNTSGEGAARMGRMTKQLRSQEAGLLSLGFTQESVNEGFGNYIEMMARSGQLRGRSDASLTAGAQNYLMEIDKLAKVTGKSRKEIQDEMNSRMAAANYNILASKLSGEALTNFTANSAFDGMLGKDFQDAMTDLADGTAQSGFAEKLASVVPGFADLAEANATGQLSQEEYQKRFRELLPQIQQFAKGLDAAGTSALMGEDGFSQLLATLDPAQKEMARLADASAAGADQAKGTTLTDTFANFEQTIQDVKSAFEKALIDSKILETVGGLIGDLGTGMTSLADGGVKFLKDYLESESFQTAMTNFKTWVADASTKLQKFVTDIGDVGFGEAIKNLFASEDGKGIDVGAMFGDFIGSAFKSLLPSMDTVIVGLGAVIGTLLFTAVTGPFALIGIGLAAMFGWETIKGFAVDSWNAITGVFTSIIDWFAGIDIMTPITTMWETVKGWFTFGEGESFSIGAVGTKMWASVTGWFSMEGTDFSIAALGKVAWEAVKGWFSFLDTTFSISDTAKAMWNTVTGWFGFGEGEAAFGISQLAKDAWATVTGWFGFGEGESSFSISNLVNGAWETVTGFFSFGDMEMPSISELFKGIVDKVKGFFSFDFEMPNFKQYLPSWLGGEGKSLFGGGDSGEPGTTATAAVTNPEPMPNVSTPENVAALGTLNYGFQLEQAKLLKAELADISTMSNFNTELERMQTGLDNSNVEAYNTSMLKLVDTLDKLNDVLSEDNSGMFGGGTGVSAASMVGSGQIGGSGSSGSSSSDQLNTLIARIETLITAQNKGNDYTKAIVPAISGNLHIG
jgi:hypothetical protein